MRAAMEMRAFVRGLAAVMSFAAAALGVTTASAQPAESPQVFVWPDLAPGESQRDIGQAQPPRPGEEPPITRLVNIRRPSLDVFLPAESNGTGILILPGGGFSKVVPDKEGSEAAPWLNGMGIAVFVLRYRTNEATPPDEPLWQRPLQDAQRSLRLIRSRAAEWRVQPDRIGVLGFSAGGQVAAILHSAEGAAAYAAVDEVDRESSRPDFSLLIYPWKTLNAQGELLPEIRMTDASAPAFLVHTHDDASSSVGTVLIYADLKKHNVPAELHVYGNGGHGYGMRPVAGSFIGTWPERATDWLILRGLARKAHR
jgi:acetyl esterase/lipase